MHLCAASPPRSVLLAVVLACLLAGYDAASAARSCSQVHDGCVAKCMRFGIGKSRTGGISRPMPADACEAHCAGWTAECVKSGCFNGDLHIECGLLQR